MKLYRNVDGKWVGTQADAGNKDIIEVPVDKPGLLEWLNENVRQQQGSDVAHDLDNGPPVQPVVLGSPDLGKCPHCKMTHAAARRIAEGTLMDALVERIETAEGWQFDRLAQAVIERLTQLCKSLST